MNENFSAYWEKAAQIHGHKCPSLFYGVSLGLLAKDAASETTGSVVLEGSSKCIRDGVTTVLQDSPLHDKLSIITDSPECAITVSGGGKKQRFVIPRKIRRQVNQLNQELPLEEFQRKGITFLKGLADDEFINKGTI